MYINRVTLARGSAPIKDFRRSWDLACQAAGVPGLLFHDLRRTAVRNLRRAGVAESVPGGLRAVQHHRSKRHTRGQKTCRGVS